MSEIYEDSYLTLATALSPGDDYGFLDSSPERQMYIGRHVDLTDFGIESDSVKVRQIHDYRTVQSRQPLATRAWTLQETLIPQRLLTFSVAVFLECRETSFCECGSGLFADPFCADTSKFLQVDRDACARILEGICDDRGVYDYWYSSVVVPYSNRNITKLRDRLPALSALVLKFALRLNDNYLAGLWERDLIRGMDWDTRRPSRNVSGRAPSWSWASIEGPVEFPNVDVPNTRQLLHTLTVLEAKVNVSPAGVVTGGFVRVFGMTCRAWLNVEWLNTASVGTAGEHSECKYSLVRQGCEDHNQAIIFQAEVGLGPALRFDTPLSNTTNIIDGGGPSTTVQRSDNDPEEFRERVSGLVLCLLLYQYAQAGRNPARNFLILGSHPTRSDVYHRIGSLLVQYNLPAWLGDMGKEIIVIE